MQASKNCAPNWERVHIGRSNSKENLRLTVYKTEIVRAQLRAGYCTRWAPKVILGTRFFSVPDGHVSSNYEAKFLGMWS